MVRFPQRGLAMSSSIRIKLEEIQDKIGKEKANDLFRNLLSKSASSPTSQKSEKKLPPKN
jgi:hypothetical protein